MINVGIIGGETEAAGELIRILINHPDVILRGVASPDHAGERIDKFHRGLTGDTDLCFVNALDVEKLNCVFLVGEPWRAHEFISRLDAPSRIDALPEDEVEDALRIIDLTGGFLDGSDGMIYGFPEYNRKALVRGALRASVPSAIVTAVELALFPLVKNHMLQGPVEAIVELPREHGTTDRAGNPAGSGPSGVPRFTSELSTRLDPVAPAENRPDSEVAAEEISRILKTIDPTCPAKVNLRLSRNQSASRGISATVFVPGSVNVDEISRLYDDAYSDHGFTFLIDRIPSVLDVKNTNKCLISVDSVHAGNEITHGVPGIQVVAVIDDLVKGRAGSAVHCMNLLFGLSEKTGLALKASVI